MANQLVLYALALAAYLLLILLLARCLSINEMFEIDRLSEYRRTRKWI